ncbi:universal stress protein [uncultured Dokdonia sp.]|uniref:universal stress protein n=1 Tax=uncultured Dokdonia sp. TaxID=575653 RepID=UPI002608CABA|nr:universal stress protein [uncultured Dokdonia sp.]
MKHILIPVDFSVFSENALLMASHIARQQNATLHIIHMIGVMGAILDREEDKTSQEVIYKMEAAQKELSTFVDKEYLKDLEYNTTITKAIDFEQLHTLIKDVTIDLIIMGSKGASGIKELFIGSNTEKVIRHSTIPVMVIKEKIENFTLSSVAFATDFSLYSVEAFQKAIVFFKQLHIPITAVYVNYPNQFMSTAGLKEKITNFKKALTKEAQTIDFSIEIINEYSVEAGVTYACEQLKIDAISIATEGRKGLDHFFNHSVSEKLANHASIPVITFRLK